MNVQCYPVARLERLLLSTDGSEYSEGAVREAINLARTCASKLSVVSVIEANPEFQTLAPTLVEKAEREAREHLESLKSRAEKEGVDVDIIIHRSDEPYRPIVEEAARKKAQMIVIGRRGRTGLTRLIMGSVTAKVIGHSHASVLVVPRAAIVGCRNILVATDGSRHGTAAVSEAVTIAQQRGSSLTVISVVPSESRSPLDIVHSQMHHDLIAEREKRAADVTVAAAKDLSQKAGVRAEGCIFAGKPSESIIHVAKKLNADLIVLGSHGRTGLDRLLMRSVTERAIVLSPCAVLVVKASEA